MTFLQALVEMAYAVLQEASDSTQQKYVSVAIVAPLVARLKIRFSFPLIIHRNVQESLLNVASFFSCFPLQSFRLVC